MIGREGPRGRRQVRATSGRGQADPEEAGQGQRAPGEDDEAGAEAYADVAKLYIEDQAKAQTPMVFVTRDSEIPATVVEYGMFVHLLRIDGEPTPVTKLTLQYHYKQIDADTVAEKILTDEVALAKNDPTPLPFNLEYHMSNRDLWISRKQGIPVQITMRTGVAFRGLIDWFTPYEIKLNIGFRGKDGTASVILHRHAGLWIELLEEPDEEPETRPPLGKPSAEKSPEEKPAEKSEE